MILSKSIAIQIEPRPDGGVRIWSQQLRGLILSGSDPEKVMADVWPAIVALLEHKASTVSNGERDNG